MIRRLGLAASVCTVLLVSPAGAAAQPAALVEGLADFRLAIEGTFGDEGPRIAAALDRMAGALDEWRQTRGNDSRVPSLLTGAADTPLLPFAAYAQGFAQLARGDYETAVNAFRSAAARDPLVADPAAGSEVLTRAAAALRQERAADAHALLEGSDLLQDSAEAHRVLGLAYWADSRDDKSVEHLEIAVRRNPQDERSRLALSRVLSSVDRDADAVRVLHETIAAIPDSVQARWWLGWSYERLNRFADARKEFELAAAGVVAGHAPVYAAIGRLATQAADFSAAIDAFTRAVAASPDDPVMRTLLAGALLQQDRVDDALAELDAALSIDPRDAGALAAIGQSHLNAGRHDDAVKALRRAIELAPNHTEARYALATALMRLGRTQEAETEFARVEQAQQEALANRRRTMRLDVQKEEAALRAAEKASGR